MKQGLISSVLTLMFNNIGVTDNIDLMRCNILSMEIEKQVMENTATVESIKSTYQYKGCIYDVKFPDEFLQELIDKGNELKKLNYL